MNICILWLSPFWKFKCGCSGCSH